MIITAIIIFAAPIIGALFTQIFRNKANRDAILIFAGAYLLGLCLTHLIPEVFHSQENFTTIGIFVLAGFLLQQVLEVLSRGAEHGHVHTLGASSGFSLMLGLSLHSILEGTILIHPSHHHLPEHNTSIILGVFLHKIPAGFALYSICRESGFPIKKSYFFILLFALASPAGMLISALLTDQIGHIAPYFYALVTGSFLHIATTIFVESNPSHHLALKKIGIAIIGAGMAVLAEVLI